jgi:hypothetical protein
MLDWLLIQGSNFTKALKAIAVVHRFFAIESEGNLNWKMHCYSIFWNSRPVILAFSNTLNQFEVDVSLKYKSSPPKVKNH